MICEENCDDRNADGHLGQVSGNPIRDDLAADGSQSRRVGRSPPDAMSGSRSPGPVVELWDVERPCPLLAAPRDISSFGANHSSRSSRVPSCTQTMPEPSFTLRQFLLLLYPMITISEFHHCSADNLVRPQEVEVLVYLVKSKDLNAMPYLAPCGKRHNLTQVG